MVGSNGSWKDSPEQRDSFWVCSLIPKRFTIWKTRRRLTETTDFAFAVSDGMGGATGGEFASRITVDHVTHLLNDRLNSPHSELKFILPTFSPLFSTKFINR
jgi:serine/threonine protein phosphatase PrpC